jgi:hypothetical protein
MSSFDFDIDRQLENMRGLGNSPAPEKSKEPPVNIPESHVEAQKNLVQGNSGSTAPSPPPSAPPTQAPVTATVPAPEPITETPVPPEHVTTSMPPSEEPGLEVQQAHEDNQSGNDGSIQKMNSHPIKWKQFKTLPGVFEHVGGDRPVVLNDNIKRLQVSGVPEPLVTLLQELLKKRHLGAVIDFPWGTYEIEATNKVFTTKTSLFRYLLFDSLRDEAGTHVQYALQWFALQYPSSFFSDFKPKRDMNPSSDELDVYALLAVAHSADPERAVLGESRMSHDREALDRLTMLNANVDRMLTKMTAQEQKMQENFERSDIVQSTMLLERLGMLDGALPRDIGDFVRMLEVNRDVIGQTTNAVDKHMEAEQERKKTMLRDERKRQYHNSRRS